MRWMLCLLPGWLVLVGGCAVPPTPATPMEPTEERDPVTGAVFWLYVPSTCTPERPSGLIVTCHGTPPFDVARHHILEWKWYGEQYNCIVVAPKLDGTNGITRAGPVSDMIANERTIMSIISHLGYRYNIDRANVMITGFSGGGFPTYWVGLRRPDMFTCVVARNCNFSESSVDEWWAPDAVKTPILIYYGERDPIMIKSQSRNGIEYLRNNGFIVEEKVIINAGHERRPDVAMEFFRRHWRHPQPSVRK